MDLLTSIKKQTSYVSTENGATAVCTTGSCIIDFFAQMGAMRSRTDEEIADAFFRAYYCDKLLMLKMLFYLRDIRGGLGERRTFKVILKALASKDVGALLQNIELISEFGRWDDLLTLLDTPLEPKVVSIIKKQLSEDIESVNPSLLCKWLPSENASSASTRRSARKLTKLLGMSPGTYRKTLSMLRKKIEIVETKISQKGYEKIDYSKVPSKSMMKYRQAFYRNDEDRFRSFINCLICNEEKINASVLFPYEIVKMAYIEDGLREHESCMRDIYNSQWESLPDYFNGASSDTLCMIDTSGSMCCSNYLPISSALALGIYCAQKNKGRFKNHFITFSSQPKLVEIKKDKLCDIVEDIEMIISHTDIEKAFDLILQAAIDEDLKQEDLPSRIVIISDMEFDEARSETYRSKLKKTETLISSISDRYSKSGYKMPNLVFWNVESRNHQFPMRMEDGVQFVSGHSPAIFEALLSGEFLSAMDLIKSILNKSRYDNITL